MFLLIFFLILTISKAYSKVFQLIDLVFHQFPSSPSALAVQEHSAFFPEFMHQSLHGTGR
ncbi:hypothetical protein AO057_01605 [Curvibacter sp. PAE-UM]|nr:hypothetical protein AO057_01605 [Curvibacter sp. PAE-UM]